jgi:transposase-like protein
MKANLRAIQKRRRFTAEFKRSIVKDFESGKYSVLQLEKLHNIGHSLIYQWVYKYSTFNDQSFQIIEMKESSTNKVKELEKKVKELERAVGQKQLYIDYMEKMMEIAKDELGVDIKKNFNTPQSDGSGRTKKK